MSNTNPLWNKSGSSSFEIKQEIRDVLKTEPDKHFLGREIQMVLEEQKLK